jgi:hypothetical protein
MMSLPKFLPSSMPMKAADRVGRRQAVLLPAGVGEHDVAWLDAWVVRLDDLADRAADHQPTHLDRRRVGRGVVLAVWARRESNLRVLVRHGRSVPRSSLKVTRSSLWRKSTVIWNTSSSDIALSKVHLVSDRLTYT